MHDATKVLLGTSTSSSRDISSEPADPATFVAGLAVRRASDGGLQLDDDSTALLIGISLGRDLANSERTAVIRAGLGVPLRQQAYPAVGTFAITNYTNAVGDSADVAGVQFVGGSGAATPGDATFQAATSLAATATSLAAQINAHPVASLVVSAEADDDEVIVTALEPGVAGNEIDFAWTAASSAGGTASGDGALAGGSNGAAVHGKQVYTNDAGLGCKSTDDDATATGGTYDGGILTGVDAITQAETFVALVDMPGGL